MTNKFKAVFAKFKGRRAADRTKAMAAAACVTDASDADSQLNVITKNLNSMDLSRSPSLPITPSGTFDFTPPPGCPKWPGPRYDDLVQLGIFDMGSLTKAKTKPKQKRAPAKRRPSQDDNKPSSRNQPRLNAQLTNAATTKKKQRQTLPKRPQYFSTGSNTRAEPLHLLTLPGELRNEIYHLLFVSKEPLRAQYRPVLRPHAGSKGPEIRRFPREPVLALVSKQLREEATGYFYSANRFVFAANALQPKFPMTSARMLGRWRDASATTAVRHLELVFGGEAEPSPASRSKDAVTYVFRKLADGRITVKMGAEERHLCVCFDRRMVRELVPQIVKHEDGHGRADVVTAAMLYASGRASALTKLVLKEDGGYEVVAGRKCGKCGKEGRLEPLAELGPDYMME